MFELLINHQPYKMVVTSLTALSLFIFFIYSFRLIFPKKHLSYPLILLGLSLLPLLSMFRKGVYESGDFTIHVTNTIAFYNSLSEGNIVPDWAGSLNAGYGYPAFVFIYPLPYYISSLFHLIGFSFINSVKLVLSVTFIGSGFAMYYWLKNHLPEKAAFLGAILYLFAPYHLIDLHFRSDVGEVAGFVFIPLSLLLIDKSLEYKAFFWKVLAGISIALLILSHPAISLLAYPIILSYPLVRLKKLSFTPIVKAIIPSILGLLYSAYYWVPVLLEGKYTNQIREVNSILIYPTVSELLYSKWRYGLLFQGNGGELTYLLGYAHWIVILILLFIIFIKRRSNKFLVSLLLLFTVYLFLILDISRPVWDAIPTLKKMQFPYRTLSILIFISSAAGAFIFKTVKLKYIYRLLIFVAIVTTLLNWGNRRMIENVDDDLIIQNLPMNAAQGGGVSAAAPIWATTDSKLWMNTAAYNNLEILNGSVNIVAEERFNNSHGYLLNVKEKAVIKENTYYFPGWELRINGEKKEINYQNIQHPGLITFPLEKGYHFIELTFNNTPIRTLAKLLSAFSLFTSGLYLIFFSQNHLKTR